MLRRRHLGRISFAEANDFQRALLQSSDDYILVFEHPATYTKGIRTNPENFLVPEDQLQAVVIDADRGGDVTYHAPGQVVAWAVVTVPDDPSAGPAHVRRMEDAVINTVRHFDVDGQLGRVDRLEGYPGVWAHVDTEPHKICAVGIRTERNEKGERRTLHGVALNVDIDLSGFSMIVPCGIPDKPVASLTSLGLDVSFHDVEEQLGAEMEALFGGNARVAKVDRGAATTSSERPLIRRLRKAGVDPEAGVPIRSRKPEWLRIEAHMGTEYQSLRTSPKTFASSPCAKKRDVRTYSNAGVMARPPLWSTVNAARVRVASASSIPANPDRSTLQNPSVSPKLLFV